MSKNDEVLQRILDILIKIAPGDGQPVTADMDLIDDLRLDSMKVMEILEALEDSFDISIPINIVPEIRTVNDLAVEIQKITGSEY